MWKETVKEIANYYQEPQRYDYLTKMSVWLTTRTIDELLKFIIEENDFILAMYFIQPKLHLNNVIMSITRIEEILDIKFSVFDDLIAR